MFSESSLPYTRLSYIETDGTAYINTNITGTPPGSAEIKLFLPSTIGRCQILSGYCTSSGTNTKSFAYLGYTTSSRSLMFAYYYNYGPGDGTSSVAWSIENEKPFIVRTDLARRSQHQRLLEEKDSTYTVVSKTQSTNISSTYKVLLFAGYLSGSVGYNCSQGTRVYYCKIYSDTSYTNLVFDGIPVLYNGEYGLWDKITNSFFGNAASSGAFTGQ